jgi:hypothetical protein
LALMADNGVLSDIAVAHFDEKRKAPALPPLMEATKSKCRVSCVVK